MISEAGGAETPKPAAPRRWLGLGASRHVVFKLSGLFALDAFAGGFVGQSLVAYWFHLRFGVEPAVLGSIFFGANVLAGHLGAAGRAHGRPLRPDQHHGASRTSRRTCC